MSDKLSGRLETCLACAVALVLFWGAGLAFLYGTAHLPQGETAEHLRMYAILLEHENRRPGIIFGDQTTAYDNYTDGMMILTAMYPGRSLRDVLLAPHERRAPRVSQAVAMQARDQHAAKFDVPSYWETRVSDKGVTEFLYPRYWHGYLVVLRPLLALFTPQQIYLLNMGLVFWLMAGSLLAISRRFGTRVAVAWAAGLLVLGPMALPRGICWMFDAFAALGLSWLMAACRGLPAHPGRLFFLTGAVVAYMDFLTFPLLTFLLPATVWLMRSQETDAGKLLRPILLAGFAWSCGYLGMWAGKWLVCAWFLPDFPVLRDILATTTVRLNGQDLEAVPSGPLALRANWEMLRGLMPFVLCAGLWSVLQFFGESRSRWDRAHVLCLVFLALLPFCWHAVVFNHSCLHPWFAAKLMAGTVFPLLAALADRKQGGCTGRPVKICAGRL